MIINNAPPGDAAAGVNRLVPGVIYEWTPGEMRVISDEDDVVSPPPALSVGSEVVPGYRLVERIVAGHFGEVWHAIGPGGVSVALRCIEVGRAEAWQEIHSPALGLNIRHANIVSVFGTWDLDGWVVVGMELAEGSLQDRFDAATRSGKVGMDFAELADFLDQAARGIDFLNEPCHPLPQIGPVGLAHRNIKPQNLLVIGRSLKIADLRLATRWDAPEAHTRPTCGSLEGINGAFMAPEVRLGQVSLRSDQYSLAASYCYLRCGLAPTHLPGLTPVSRERGADAAPELEMLPLHERPVVARALANDPSLRWPTCGAFVAALTESVATAEQAAKPSVAGGTAQSNRRRPAWWIPASAAALILGLVGFLASGDGILTPSPDAPRTTTTATAVPSATASLNPPSRDEKPLLDGRGERRREDAVLAESVATKAADARQGDRMPPPDAPRTTSAATIVPSAPSFLDSTPRDEGLLRVDGREEQPRGGAVIAESVAMMSGEARQGDGSNVAGHPSTNSPSEWPGQIALATEPTPMMPSLPTVRVALQSWARATLRRLHAGLRSVRESVQARRQDTGPPSDDGIGLSLPSTSQAMIPSPAVVAAAIIPEPRQPRPATIVVRVPGPRAELVVRGEVGRGNPDEWYGPTRVIHTPPLDGPKDYLVGSFWADSGGNHRSRSKALRIEPGRRYQVDLQAENPTASELPPPSQP